MSQTNTVNGKEHATATEAIVELNFSGDRAIAVCGRYFSISNAEMDRLESMGIEPTTFHLDSMTGRLVSVPGRHG